MACWNGSCGGREYANPSSLHNSGRHAMFTLGQTIVLGLAGSIYVVGAAFLLGGRAVLKSEERAFFDTTGGQIVPAGTIGGAPYFVPALDGGTVTATSTGTAASTRASSSAANKGASGARGRPPRPMDCRGAARGAASLRNPLCLN